MIYRLEVCPKAPDYNFDRYFDFASHNKSGQLWTGRVSYMWTEYWFIGEL